MLAGAGSAAAIAAACQAPIGGPAASGAAASPRSGGSIVVDPGQELTLIDPQQNPGNQTVKNLTNNFAENLVWRDVDMQIKPRLAASWNLAADGVTWTFKLRQGVKFHDGTPLNAAAVKANVDRWFDPKSVAILKTTYTRIIKSARAVDDSTIEFVTNGPQAAFLGVLAGWGTNILSAQQISSSTPQQINAKPIGTGPFKIQSFTPGESIVMVRNDDYWGQKAYLDQMTFKYIVEPSARTAALLTGQVDLTMNVSASQLDALRASKDVKLVQQLETVLAYWVSMNCTRPTLKDPRVRQAVNYAVNNDALKQLAGGLQKPFQGPVVPAIYTPKTAVGGYTFDVAKAKGLLQQAGVTSAKLRFPYISYPDGDRYVQALQEQLRQVGLELDPVRLDAAGAFAAQAGGDYDLFIDGFGNSSGDPHPTLLSALNSRSPRNYAKYGSPKMDDLIDKLGAELDQTKRSAILDDIYKVFFDDVPWVGMYANSPAFAFVNRLQGFTLGKVIGPMLDMSLEQLWVTQ